MAQSSETRALFNGDCPVCNAEMCNYSAYSETQGLPIAFDDLNRTDLARWGVSEDRAARLLHVMQGGEVHVGFDAFLVLWDQMPKYRMLARIGRLPGIYQACSWGYAHIVARVIYERHKRRRARRQAPSQ